MKYRADRPLLPTFLGRVLSLSAAAALTVTAVLAPALADDDHPAAAISAGIQTKTRFLALGIGKSMIVDLPREAKDVLIADQIATAVIRRRSAPTLSARRSAKPTSCSSIPQACKSPPMTSPSSGTSMACALR